MKLSLDEQELTINITGDNRNMADVYTDDTVWMERLKAAGWQPYRTNRTGAWFSIPTNRIICIRSSEMKPLTPKQLAALESARQAKLKNRIESE